MFQLQNLQIVFKSHIWEYGYNKVVKLAGSQLKPQILFILRCKYLSECHDTQYDYIQHNDTQPSDTQHNGLTCDSQHNITQYDGTVCCVAFRGILSVVVLYVVMLSAVILSVVAPSSETNGVAYYVEGSIREKKVLKERSLV